MVEERTVLNSAGVLEYTQLFDLKIVGGDDDQKKEKFPIGSSVVVCVKLKPIATLWAWPAKVTSCNMFSLGHQLFSNINLNTRKYFACIIYGYRLFTLQQ